MNAAASNTKGRRMLMWILIVAGGLAGLFGVSMAIGMLLPSEYSFTIERHFNADVDRVWQVLHNHETYPYSTTQCRSVEVLATGEDNERWAEDMGSSTITYERVEHTSPKRLVIRAHDSVVPLSFECEITLTTTPDGTTVRMQTQGRIDRGTFHVPFFRLIIHCGGAKAGMSKYLESIAQGLGTP